MTKAPFASCPGCHKNGVYLVRYEHDNLARCRYCGWSISKPTVADIERIVGSKLYRDSGVIHRRKPAAVTSRASSKPA